jgi:hypothetical protein
MRVAPPPVKQGLSFDCINLLVVQASDTMKESVESLERYLAETYLTNLRRTVERIASTFPRHPPYDSRYMWQWDQFLSGIRGDLDHGTTRYLCWEPDIATDERFLTYVLSSSTELTERPLAGLVRSCHSKWEAAFPVSKPVGMVRDLLMKYEGQSPVICKWKSNLEAVLGTDGPQISGRNLVEGGKTLHLFLEEWYLDPLSPFALGIVETATGICRQQFAHPSRRLVELLFRELLLWPRWNSSRLKQEISALILRASDNQAREVLQKFVLLHKDLGDPRLPENETKWTAMSQEARARVVQWLSKNPVHFLEHVYQQGKGWTWRAPAEEPYRTGISAALK